MVHLITYDLLGNYVPSERYTNIGDGIKRLGPWAHIQKSVFLVESNLESKQIAEWLYANFLNQWDKLFVVPIDARWVAYNLDGDQVNWLGEKLFNNGLIKALLAAVTAPKTPASIAAAVLASQIPAMNPLEELGILGPPQHRRW